MKKNKPLLILFALYCISCNNNFYGDINLGGDFYYLVEPAFNVIGVPTNPKEPYKSGSNVIQNIETIGFNKAYILVTSIDSNSTYYWLIDKTKKRKELGYENSMIKLSNVNTIDSVEFYTIMNDQKIKIKTREYYCKESGYCR